MHAARLERSCVYVQTDFYQISGFGVFEAVCLFEV